MLGLQGSLGHSVLKVGAKGEPSPSQTKPLSIYMYLTCIWWSLWFKTFTKQLWLNSVLMLFVFSFLRVLDPKSKWDRGGPDIVILPSKTSTPSLCHLLPPSLLLVLHLTILQSEASSGCLKLLPTSWLLLWIIEFYQDWGISSQSSTRTSWSETASSLSTELSGPRSGLSPGLLQDGRSTVLFGCVGRRSPADPQSWR